MSFNTIMLTVVAIEVAIFGLLFWLVKDTKAGFIYVSSDCMGSTPSLAALKLCETPEEIAQMLDIDPTSERVNQARLKVEHALAKVIG